MSRRYSFKVMCLPGDFQAICLFLYNLSIFRKFLDPFLIILFQFININSISKSSLEIPVFFSREGLIVIINSTWGRNIFVTFFVDVNYIDHSWKLNFQIIFATPSLNIDSNIGQKLFYKFNWFHFVQARHTLISTIINLPIITRFIDAECKHVRSSKRVRPKTEVLNECAISDEFFLDFSFLRLTCDYITTCCLYFSFWGIRFKVLFDRATFEFE